MTAETLPKIVPFYSSLFAVYYLMLSSRVVSMRRKYLVSLGDGTLEYLAYIESERVKKLNTDEKSNSVVSLSPPFTSRKLDLARFREIQRSVRAHANFAEYIPFALMLLFFSEFNGYVSSEILHIACISLFIGRFAHANLAFATPIAVSVWRPIGVSLTFLVILFAAVLNIYSYLF